jgi:hypothetical protein
VQLATRVVYREIRSEWRTLRLHPAAGRPAHGPATYIYLNHMQQYSTRARGTRMNALVLYSPNDRSHCASRVKRAARPPHHLIIRLIRSDIRASPVPPRRHLRRVDHACPDQRRCRQRPEVEISRVPQHHLPLIESNRNRPPCCKLPAPENTEKGR